MADRLETKRTAVDPAAATTELASEDTALAPTVSRPRLIDEPADDLLVFHAHDRYAQTLALGEGGMGEVLLCRDRQIGREVAMKLVRSEYEGDRDRRARLLREARIQGQLEHPAIVPVYDLERDRDGRAFFTMKRVRGETLEDILERLRQGNPDALREHTRHGLLSAFTRICLAVDFAHVHGVLHRDLKPSNVMLGRFGEVYVLDWGLAKLIGAEERPADGAPQSRVATDSGTHTAVGDVLGTPAYMAPEQVEGAANVGPRADVYALGAILFEILTLEPLHGAGQPARMLKRVLQGIEARPSVRAPDRAVPPELEVICVRATSRDPRERYASARELGEAVEAHLRGDRDLELRSAIAKQHLSNAKEAAAAALADGSRPDERTTALREVGRALALAPDDEDALRLLVRLLTEPPKVLPQEVSVEIEAARISSQQRMLALAALTYLAVAVLFAATSIALGVADVRLVGLAILAWAAAAGVAFYGAKVARSETGVFRAVTVAGAVAIASTSLLFGALVIVPALAGVNAMGHTLTTARYNRAFVVGMNVAAVVIPTGLAWAGLHPVHHVLVDPHRLEIAAGGLSWPPYALGLLGLAEIAIILMAARFVSRYRDALTDAETRNALQSWQLRRLVPDPAARSGR